MANLGYETRRQALEARRQNLLRDLELKLRDVRYEGDPSQALDIGDSSNAELQQEIDISLVEMRSEALRRVDEALTRLSEGVCGQCAECGDEISPARLDALPFAVRCLDCEVVHESTIGARRASQEELVFSKWLASSSHG